MKKTAIILANLGGPDSLDAVEPFLFNLFNDPAIISLPNPFRHCLARWIAKKRTPAAQDIYKNLGGRSPLLPMTEAQARALDDALNENHPEDEFKSFIAMRYWHPMSLETAEQVKKYNPDQILFLPLYPQYSTTTTGSSLAEWNRAARAAGLGVPIRAVCCYPVQAGWIAAQCDLVVEKLTSLDNPKSVRLLFSAHGLPKKIIEKGDPYQEQVEKTAQALISAIQGAGYPDLDWVVCYQSKVGPLQWTEPSTESEIRRAAVDGMGVMIVPVAFVSEHSETLVELDIEYRELAREAGISNYHRVPTVGTHAAFIKGLSDTVLQRLQNAPSTDAVAPADGLRLCSENRSRCPFRKRGAHEHH